MWVLSGAVQALKKWGGQEVKFIAQKVYLLFLYRFCFGINADLRKVRHPWVLSLPERVCQAEFSLKGGNCPNLSPLNQTLHSFLASRLKERTDIDRLPDNVMLKVFRNLTTKELLTAGKVRGFSSCFICQIQLKAFWQQFYLFRKFNFTFILTSKQTTNKIYLLAL